MCSKFSDNKYDFLLRIIAEQPSSSKKLYDKSSIYKRHVGDDKYSDKITAPLEPIWFL